MQNICCFFNLNLYLTYFQYDPFKSDLDKVIDTDTFDYIFTSSRPDPILYFFTYNQSFLNVVVSPCLYNVRHKLGFMKIILIIILEILKLILIV